MLVMLWVLWNDYSSLNNVKTQILNTTKSKFKESGLCCERDILDF